MRTIRAGPFASRASSDHLWHLIEAHYPVELSRTAQPPKISPATSYNRRRGRLRAGTQVTMFVPKTPRPILPTCNSSRCINRQVIGRGIPEVVKLDSNFR